MTFPAPLLMAFAVLAACGALCVLLPADKRKPARQAFVILLTLFVVGSLALTASRRGGLARSEPVLEQDRAELLLRFGSAYEALTGSMPVPPPTTGKQVDFHQDAIKILDDTASKDPDIWVTDAKLAIVLADEGKDRKRFAALISKLKAKQNEEARKVGEAFESIYLKGQVEKSKKAEYQALFDKNLPAGWYRDSVTLRLLKVTADPAYNDMRESLKDRSLGLFMKFIGVLLVGGIAGLVGVVSIVVQLFTLPRRLGDPEDEAGGEFAPPWDWKTVYVVFIFWLATQIVLGSAAQLALKSSGLMTASPLLAGLGTAAVYLLGNAPGLFYIYWFACRPYGLNLWRTVRLRTKSGTLGPVKLSLIGLLSWCTAIPVVVTSYLIASKFLGSQGSSNPIIALVLEAARSSDWLAILIFYFTLGVLAPLCEETLFRGFLYRSLRKYIGVGTAVFVSAAIFAAVHLDAGAVVPLLGLGWIFGFVFERTKSLLPSIIAHGLWNSGTFTLVLLIFGQ